jgi:hypothetical protein
MPQLRRIGYFAIGLPALTFVLVITSEPYRIAIAAARSSEVEAQIGEVRFHVLALGTVSWQEGDESKIRLYLFGRKGSRFVTVTVVKESGVYKVKQLLLD